jgi:hypothetical protein
VVTESLHKEHRYGKYLGSASKVGLDSGGNYFTPESWEHSSGQEDLYAILFDLLVATNGHVFERSILAVITLIPITYLVVLLLELCFKICTREDFQDMY